MIRFNIGELLHAPVGATLTFELNLGLVDLDEDLSVEGLSGRLVFLQTDKGILGNGTFWAEIDTECARCLEPMRTTVEIELEERFRLASCISANHPACPIDGEGWVDLKPIFRDLVLVALPMQPLCKADCKGLCPNCGHNLNEGPCNCLAEEIDPRMAVLQSLLRHGTK